MLLPLLLSSLAQAAPPSLIAGATNDLFRLPLDLMEQPASLARVESSDLLTLLSTRTHGATLSAGWVGRARRVGLGVFGSTDFSSLRSAEVIPLVDVQPQLSRLQTWSGDLSLGIPIHAGLALGARAWTEGAASRRGVAWRWREDADRGDTTTDQTGALPLPASEVRYLQHSTGGAIGLRVERGARYTELDLELERHFTRTLLDLYDPDAEASAAGLLDTQPRNNLALWSPGWRIDAIIPGQRSVDLRVWNRVALDLGGLAKPAYIELGPGERSGVDKSTLRWDPARYRGAHGDLLLVAHVRWPDLELRVGGGLSLRYLGFSGTLTETLEHNGDEVLNTSEITSTSSASATLTLPLSIVAPVSRQVDLIAGASVSYAVDYQHSGTEGLDEGLTTLDQYGFGGGSLAIRWRANPRVTLDIGGRLRSNQPQFGFGAGFGSVSNEETYEPLLPTAELIDPGLTGSGPLLGASASLTIHL